MRDNAGDILERFRRSALLRMILIGFLILMLQIPILLIRAVIGEREMRLHEATRDITSKWGEQQTIVGPLITVPYIVKISEKDNEGNVTIHTQVRHATFLPESLHMTGTVDCEVRYRGIFKVPVYRMNLSVTGWFLHPNFSDWGVPENDILWDQAYLSVRISDVHAITDSAVLTWNDDQKPFLPGAGEFDGDQTGIHADLKASMKESRYDFSYQLMLNGSQGAFFAPFGRETKVEIDSNWDAPGFQGTWLPTERTFEGGGFDAMWDIPFLGRNYPQKWRSNSSMDHAVSSSLFGVRFVTPVDHYRMAQRSIKYEILFLVLTFATLWLFEILTSLRIHSIQYLLVGAGMCLFYLLELSLAEHISFIIAYICASAAILVLVTAYCVAVLKGADRAAIVGITITLLYGYLYVLLMNQDYALLIGSVGLFVILAVVMYLTRKVDWHSLGT